MLNVSKSMLQYICKPKVVLHSQIPSYYYIPLDTFVSNYKNLVVYFVITVFKSVLPHNFYFVILFIAYF